MNGITEQILVSVIIPAYNVENYIPKCLSSLINQSLKDIEIIVIDDGSTDKTPDIIKEYANKDERIKIITQTNQKQGAARNRGLEIARGEYVTFVDADDWIDENYLEELYRAVIDNGVNMAAASMTRDKINKIKPHLTLTTEKVYRGAADIITALDNHYETAGKLYKRELIKDLRFQEGVFFEDGGFTIRAIFVCKTAVTVPGVTYHYVSNPHSTIKQKSGKNLLKDKITTSLDLINFAEENNIKIKDWVIFKERHLLWTIKHYKYHKDYYFFGVKTFSNREIFSSENFSLCV